MYRESAIVGSVASAPEVLNHEYDGLLFCGFKSLFYVLAQSFTFYCCSVSYYELCHFS